MVMVFILPIGIGGFCNLLCPDFPVHRRNFQHLMAAVLDGPSFVGRYMACVGCDNPFVGAEHGINHHGIGLGASGKEEHIPLRHPCGGAYPVSSGF